MKSIEVLNEVKPKFPPKVQEIWDDCGTYIESINAVVAADELEFFVEQLINSISIDFSQSDGSYSSEEWLVHKGYTNE